MILWQANPLNISSFGPTKEGLIYCKILMLSVPPAEQGEDSLVL